MDLRLHHIGIAVRDVSRATEDYVLRLGCQPEGTIIHDSIQTAFIQFLRFRGDSVLLELVAPDGPESKLRNAVEKGGGLHHICHSTKDIEAACLALQQAGMMIIQDPIPAVAIGGRRVAWLIGRDRVLSEIIERDRHDE
jgi:methylmalonyl-CoA/ethylmalonyl-CoA epimerase